MQGFVVSVGQIDVEIYEAHEPQAAEHHERVVELYESLEILVILGHGEAEEEVHRRADAATHVFTPEKCK